MLEAVSYDKKRGSGAGAGAAGANGDGAGAGPGMPPFVLVDAPGAVRAGCVVGEADVRLAIEELIAS